MVGGSIVNPTFSCCLTRVKRVGFSLVHERGNTCMKELKLKWLVFLGVSDILPENTMSGDSF